MVSFYNMKVATSDGNNLHQGGEWEVLETKNTVRFKLISDDTFYGWLMPKKITISKNRGSKHVLRKDDEGFIVYPFRSGIPHIFTKKEACNGHTHERKSQ